MLPRTKTGLVGLLLVALAVVVPLGLIAAVTLPHAFSNGSVADATAVNQNFAAVATAVDAFKTTMNGVKRDCPVGMQTYNATTDSWSTCPTTWSCTSDPTHAGCVSASTYTTCQAIKADATFTGGDGTYFIDPDGAGANNAPFSVYCDMTNGGWTRLGRFNGTTDDFTMSAAQALTIPFKEARLSLNDSGSVKIIACSDTPVAGNLQTTATDKACSNGSGWYIRFRIASPVSQWANYGFYRGALTANNGGCNWGLVTEVWGRHNPTSSLGGTCTALGLGQQYESGSAFGANYLYMYIR